MFVFAGATLDGFPELYGPRLLRHRDSIIDFSFFFHFSFHFCFLVFYFSHSHSHCCCCHFLFFFFFTFFLPASVSSTYQAALATATDKHVHAKRHDLHRGMRIYANIYIYPIKDTCVCVRVVVVCHFSAAAVACHSARHAAANRQLSKNGQQKTDNNFVLIAVNFMHEWAYVEQGEWPSGCCSEMRLAYCVYAPLDAAA